MFKKILLISFLLFFFPAFGEETPEQKGAVPKENVQIKKGVQAKEDAKAKKDVQVKEDIQIKKETQTKEKSETLVPSVEPEQKLPELMTYPEALEKYREVARLEWMGGVGVTSFAEIIFFPLVLEVQTSLSKINERFTWLFQAGGILLKFPVKRVYIVNVYSGRRATGFKGGELIIAPLLQTGLRYNFLEGTYGSLTAGPIVAFGDPDSLPVVLWTGGLFFGFGNDSFTIEMGVQPLYQDKKNWDFGFVINIKSVLKKWWSEK